MSSRVVGKVAITPKGTWNALSSYEKLDAVVQNNVMYIAKINVPVGTAVTDTAYWWRSIGLSSDSTDLYLFDDEELETLADEDFIPFFSTENSSGRKISWESIKNRISAFIHGIPSGGTTGQVLKKTSGVDFDVEWGDGGGSGTAGLTEISSADYDDLPDEDKQNPDIAYFLPDGVGSDVVDDELDSTSHNPVENMAIATAIGTLTTNVGNKMDKANPTGTGSFSLNRKADTTVGSYSFAEGRNCTASGSRSHAEGSSTTASGTDSHAEGASSTASGDYSHAENFDCTASGMDSHAEGRATTASKAQSHAEGYNTKASSPQQHAQGKYNIEDSASKYADIIGWGSSDSNRANIETTDTNGVKWAKSDVRCGGTSQDDASAISLTQLNSDLSELINRLGKTTKSLNDFDDYNEVTSKFTFVANSFNIIPFVTATSHQPRSSASWGFMIVYFGGDAYNVMQEVHYNDGDIYARRYQSGAWTTWIEIKQNVGWTVTENSSGSSNTATFNLSTLTNGVYEFVGYNNTAKKPNDNSYVVVRKYNSEYQIKSDYGLSTSSISGSTLYLYTAGFNGRVAYRIFDK